MLQISLNIYFTSINIITSNTISPVEGMFDVISPLFGFSITLNKYNINININSNRSYNHQYLFYGGVSITSINT